LNPKLCHFVRSRETCFPGLSHLTGFEGARRSAVPQVIPFRATVWLEVAPLKSKPHADVFSNLLAPPKQQVPRLLAAIRKRMMALRSE
jgi:hypothetical protein